jgi:hypothetical protein
MTRTTDDPNPEPFQPLGEKVTRPPVPDLKPEWRPRPGSPGIEENAQGRMRTTPRKD